MTTMKDLHVTAHLSGATLKNVKSGIGVMDLATLTIPSKLEAMAIDVENYGSELSKKMFPLKRKAADPFVKEAQDKRVKLTEFMEGHAKDFVDLHRKHTDVNNLLVIFDEVRRNKRKVNADDKLARLDAMKKELKDYLSKVLPKEQLDEAMLKILAITGEFNKVIAEVEEVA